MFTLQLDRGWVAGWHQAILHTCISEVKAIGSVPCMQKGLLHWLCLGGQVEKSQFDVVPNGRMLCSQAPFCKGTPCSTKGSLSSGETHGCKKQRETPGKRLVHYSPLKSSPASGFLKEDSGQQRGCGLRLRFVGRGKGGSWQDVNPHQIPWEAQRVLGWQQGPHASTWGSWERSELQ